MITLILFFVFVTSTLVYEYRKGPTPSSAFYIALYITGLIVAAMFTSLGIMSSYYFTYMVLLPVPSAITAFVIIKIGSALKSTTSSRKKAVAKVKQAPITKQRILHHRPQTISRSLTHFSQEASLWRLYAQQNEEAFWNQYEQILTEKKQERIVTIQLAG
ncbi:hypothetical protein BKI52_44160 [marine bacterium AO1-C]|nr:hypothetical protein BKI52_44160 [marine bacterium AO1-C]